MPTKNHAIDGESLKHIVQAVQFRLESKNLRHWDPGNCSSIFGQFLEKIFIKMGFKVTEKLYPWLQLHPFVPESGNC